MRILSHHRNRNRSSIVSAVVVLALMLFAATSLRAEAAAASKFETLYTFTGGSDGASPYAGLIQDAAGNLYGATFAGGTANLGTVFKIDTTGKYSVLHSFTGSPDGLHPTSTLLLDSAGDIYGVCYQGGTSNFGAVFKLDQDGNESVIHSFGARPDGEYPGSALIEDELGNLYGTTGYGGATDNGTVYKLRTSGEEKVLHSFSGRDGQFPFSTLIRDGAGNIYGTTSMGGGFGNGTVFKMNRKGKSVSIYSFAGGSDGANPYAGLVRGVDGNLYGTTYYGGAGCQNYDCGTVFKITPDGKESVVHIFTGVEGYYPDFGTLVRDAAGNLYGTTYAGGFANMGVVFKIDTSGQVSVLYNFTGGDDEGFPVSGLLLDKAGNLYGTTLGYPNPPDITYGTVFKIAP